MTPSSRFAMLWSERHLPLFELLPTAEEQDDLPSLAYRASRTRLSVRGLARWFWWYYGSARPCRDTVLASRDQREHGAFPIRLVRVRAGAGGSFLYFSLIHFAISWMLISACNLYGPLNWVDLGRWSQAAQTTSRRNLWWCIPVPHRQWLRDVDKEVLGISHIAS